MKTVLEAVLEAEYEYQDDLEDIFGPLLPTLHDAHVWLFYGHDLFAAGIRDYIIAPCPFHESTWSPENVGCILTDEDLGWRHIFNVVCGCCGARGPWGNTESAALEKWNGRVKS